MLFIEKVRVSVPRRATTKVINRLVLVLFSLILFLLINIRNLTQIESKIIDEDKESILVKALI